MYGNSHVLLGGVQNGTATLEDSLVISYKIKYILTIQSGKQTFGTYPKERKLRFTQKSTHSYL